MFGWKTKIAPRRMADSSAACDGAIMKTRGLLAGTKVATSMGWRVVEALTAGDTVLTFDNGLQTLIEVRRDTFWVADMMVPAAYASVMVPAGALGNSQDLELLPDQGVLVESDAACDASGDPFAVIAAKTLVGYRGITRIAPRSSIEVITLVFADEQVIYAEGGALVHCPRAHICLSELGIDTGGYDVVPARDAAFLIECMMVEDQIAMAA
ncbi:Hint domain-containing protein [Tateyamaria sp.]|uniref:Hint domain-containing protein n=1 Tax=Tateyamaria sp. TaxID=1929288 RepID=UPI00329F570E